VVVEAEPGSPTLKNVSDERVPTPRAIALLALGAALGPWLAALLLPSFAQPQSYHDFADQRTLGASRMPPTSCPTSGSWRSARGGWSRSFEGR
jgi:hypothetical protein